MAKSFRLVHLLAVATLLLCVPEPSSASPHSKPSSLSKKKTLLGTNHSKKKILLVQTPTQLSKKNYKNYQVKLVLKIVYATTQTKRMVDPRLRKDLPNLVMYDFNVFKLLNRHQYSLRFLQSAKMPLVSRYSISLRPLDFRKNKIAIRATFWKLDPKSSQQKSFFSARIRLQDGGKVVFIGPTYKYGRVLLVLTAKRVFKA